MAPRYGLTMASEGCALITGASAGLGAEIATLFAVDGYDLILVARRKDRLQEVADKLSSEYGVQTMVVAEDLSQRDGAFAVFAAVKTVGWKVDFLVNNAGFGSCGPFVEQDLGRELDMIQVNCSALVQLSHLFLPQMKERGSGNILNIASTAGFQPGPRMAVYYASKAFVLSFSEAVAHELRGSGVSVTAHCPGATATEFAGVAGNDKTKLFSAGVADSQSVARHAYHSMHREKIVAIHGAGNKFGAFMVRLGPRALVRSIAHWVNS